MKLIILTGAPASGKSSLSKALSERTSIEFVSKDDLKIGLFEQYGFTSHDQKKSLSKLSEKMLYERIKDSILKQRDIIVDNNFKNYDIIRSYLHDYCNVTVYCIYCVASSDILAKRYNERITSGNRHEALYTLNQYPVIDGVSKFHPIITADDVERIQMEVREKTFGDFILEINTDNIDVDFDSLCDSIMSFCGLSKIAREVK